MICLRSQVSLGNAGAAKFTSCHPKSQKYKSREEARCRISHQISGPCPSVNMRRRIFECNTLVPVAALSRPRLKAALQPKDQRDPWRQSSSLKDCVRRRRTLWTYHESFPITWGTRNRRQVALETTEKQGSVLEDKLKSEDTVSTEETSNPKVPDWMKLQKVLTVSNLEDQGQDLEYWLSRTPEERIEAVEFLRQMTYGYDPATARVERILEIADLTLGQVYADRRHSGGLLRTSTNNGRYRHLG